MPEPDPAEAANPEAAPTQSIFNPDAGVEPNPALLRPLEASIGFPMGGNELDGEAQVELETILESPQFQAGGSIVLRGHSDSSGTDEANIRASQARANAVRDWLTDKGASRARITTIAFGEQNPVAPNALPDGLPDEDGRSRNRRVDVTVDVPGSKAAPAATQKQTLVEQITED